MARESVTTRFYIVPTPEASSGAFEVSSRWSKMLCSWSIMASSICRLGGLWLGSLDVLVEPAELLPHDVLHVLFGPVAVVLVREQDQAGCSARPAYGL